jgi:hypothetical protein
MTFFPSGGLGAAANRIVTMVPTGPQSRGYMSYQHAMRHVSFYLSERILIYGAMGRSLLFIWDNTSW